MPTPSEFLDEKRGERSIEDIRSALRERGVEVDHSTVWRWFQRGKAGRLPQLKSWAVLCDVLGLTDDDLRTLQGLVAEFNAKAPAELPPEVA